MTNSEVAIRVEGLGKKYCIQRAVHERHNTLRDAIEHKANTAKRLLNPFTIGGLLQRGLRQVGTGQTKDEEEFWALRDVSFEVQRGDRMGIIGRNGAGKSTLLKILSRITEPSTGRVELRGRMASLLEVGTGFHPDLTGRENIYLNGAILGMTRREIKTRFDEIVNFAEVERFLETPVKRYSSGMYVRLAFAVAAFLEPDILVIDEVLAVGDADFQEKCIGKIKGVSREEGRTVLFVSHNIRAIESLCNSGLLLESGHKSRYSRDIRSLIAKYQSRSVQSDADSQPISIHKDGFQFFRPVLKKDCTDPQSDLVSLNPTHAIVRVDRHNSDEVLSIGICITRRDVDIPIMQSFNVDHHLYGKPFSRLERDVTYNIPLHFNSLADGEYRIEVLAAIHNHKWIIRPGEHAVSTSFTIRSTRDDGSLVFKQTRRNAIMLPIVEWKHL